MSTYNIVAETDEATVVAEYVPESRVASAYQSEAELERDFILRLEAQGYDYLDVKEEAALVANLRVQLERLNNIRFSDSEWKRFFDGVIAPANKGALEKTRLIQEDHVQAFARDGGETVNVMLIDKKRIHNNSLQVINQYEEHGGRRETRYDVTILVNGLPLVHVELKRRGVALREAFNQIARYGRESFWGGAGLYDYVQIFVISNGTHTKYYSNTTRAQRGGRRRNGGAGGGFEFTSCWADARNKVIADLTDFTRTFFARHTLLNILTRYCVFTAPSTEGGSDRELMVMRPYQIAATERILNRIELANNYKYAGTVKAGGYVWHTTGSGKTLTSFKTALLASQLDYVDKVLFVVDRKDLDYQTMKEYDRFEKGAANGNTSTAVLQRQLEDQNARIIVTTIQKLDRFISKNRKHEVYSRRVVIIFDECHRSQFGDMHARIVKFFRNYHLFGFTGTPIFSVNAVGGAKALTTAQIFGDKLHTYTIVDAINDGNVLPFRIDYVNTIKMADGVVDEQVRAIDEERALDAPERVREVVSYVLDNFDRKTKRGNFYLHDKRRVDGFNSIFAASSIPMAIKYYREFKRQLAERRSALRVATIFSFAPNEAEPEGLLPDENFEPDSLDASSRDFLDGAIQDYNELFKQTFRTSADKFEGYYKDLSKRMKKREIDILIVVNMFLTGFDAKTLNTLWVDKNLRQHGLIQAYSRTNRILNSVKTFGNIVCFRDLKQETDEAIALFGDKEAGGVVLMKSYKDYYEGYDENGAHKPGYAELIEELQNLFPLGGELTGEDNKKAFIELYGAILRIRNILSAFDEFEGDEILSARDCQDYQSRYIDLYNELRPRDKADKEDINDDIVFELELVKQVEVNIDYILMLVAKYHAANCKDKEILVSIEKAVNASMELRSKRELIEGFIARVNFFDSVDEGWREYVRESREKEIEALIAEERLKPEPARRFIEQALKDGELRTTGTDIDKIMPPAPLFGGGGKGGRAKLREALIEKLKKFFEKYFGAA